MRSLFGKGEKKKYFIVKIFAKTVHARPSLSSDWRTSGEKSALRKCVTAIVAYAVDTDGLYLKILSMISDSIVKGEED